MAYSTSVDSSDEYVCMTYYLKTPGSPTIPPNDPSATQESVKTPIAAKPSSLLSSTHGIPAAPSKDLGELRGPVFEPAYYVPVLPEQELSFAALGNKFSALLPQRVQVTRAVYAYGENEDALLTQDDIYDVHFVHRRKTATLVSPAGQQYNVPINSALKFGLVYEFEHIHGSVFPTVYNIIEAENRPKVVCSQKTYIGSMPDKTVRAGEILAVVNIKSVNGCTSLTVYSFSCKIEKQLPFFCTASFTTIPSEVQLPLWEIVENVRGPFPSKVVPFAGTSRPSDFSKQFFSQTYNMIELRETATIVASPQLSDSYSKEMEIPFDVDVKITFTKLTDEEMSALRADTQSVLERYNESSIEHLWLASNFDHNRHQSQLFRNVHPLQSANYYRSATVAIEYETESASSENEEWPPCTAAGLEVTDVNHYHVEKELTLLKEISDNFSKELQSLRKDMTQMQSQIIRLSEALQRLTPDGATASSRAGEENRQYLRTLSSEQVIRLLTFLKLEQYCEIFAAERIDGEMLAEMDEAIMMKELGINSKLHRIRLLVVINGQQRAKLQHECV